MVNMRVKHSIKVIPVYSTKQSNARFMVADIIPASIFPLVTISQDERRTGHVNPGQPIGVGSTVVVGGIHSVHGERGTYVHYSGVLHLDLFVMGNDWWLLLGVI